MGVDGSRKVYYDGDKTPRMDGGDGMGGETTFTRGGLTVVGRWNTPSERGAAQFAQVWVDVFEKQMPRVPASLIQQNPGD